jgi:hypothetical protein
MIDMAKEETSKVRISGYKCPKCDTKLHFDIDIQALEKWLNENLDERQIAELRKKSSKTRWVRGIYQG